MEDGHDGLQRSLSLSDLIGFGVAAIMGEGGFNLISKGVVAGGPSFPAALGIIGALFQGASKVYSDAYTAFKSNTAESDLVEATFGSAASSLTSLAILAFNIFSVSTVIVFTAKNILPTASWWSQIGLALTLLSAMSGFALQGIQVNKLAIGLFSAAITGMLALAGGIGVFEAFGGKGPGPMSYPHILAKSPNFLQSLLYFYFVLAGFDDIIKFVREAKDPDRDIPRSFHIVNALCLLLVVGVAYAYLHVLTFKRDSHYHGENALALIIESAFGAQAGKSTYWIGVFLMLTTAFVSFLAITRYMYDLPTAVKGEGLREALKGFQELNAKKVPWKAVAVTFGVGATAILVNHIDTLVNASDFFLSLVMVLVSGAATVSEWRAGRTPVIEGLTTAGFAGLLSASFLV